MATAVIRSSDIFTDPAFPLTLQRHPQHETSDGLHRHEFHELVIITSGKGRYCTGDGEYRIGAGDAFLLRGEMHHGYADTHDMGLINILFHPHRLGLPLNELRDIPGYHVLFRVEPRLRERDRFRGRLALGLARLRQACELAEALDQELTTQRPGYRFAARAHLMQLITFLARAYTRDERQRLQPLFGLGEILAHLDGHYSEAISVDALVAMAHMSRSTLMRTFRRVTGKTPIDYLLQIRLDRARVMLSDPERSITEIAFACGFQDSNYFSRRFREALGVSPRAFRQEQAGLTVDR